MKIDFSTISEKTMIPISFLIVIYYLLDFALGLKAQCDQNTQALAKTESSYSQIINKLEDNSKKLSRIEGIIEFILEGKK